MLNGILKKLFFYWFIVVSIAVNFEFFHFHSFRNITSNSKEIQESRSNRTFVPIQQCLLEEFIFLPKTNPNADAVIIFFSSSEYTTSPINTTSLFQNPTFHLHLRSPPIQFNTNS